MPEAGGQLGPAPSQIRLDPIPLVGCFGSVEAEAAATLLVRACVYFGDRWQAVAPRQLGESLSHDLKDELNPVHGLRNNPVWRPDFFRLVAGGWARWASPELAANLVEFTPAGLRRLPVIAMPAATASSWGKPVT